MATEERWRFEPDTALMDTMVSHYEQPIRACFHTDEIQCARAMLSWLENRGIVIVPASWVKDE